MAGLAIPTPTDISKADFLERATIAFQRSLAELLENSSVPGDEPESLGEQAGLAAAASSFW